MDSETSIRPNISDSSLDPSRRALLLLAAAGVIGGGLANLLEPETTEAKKKKRKKKKCRKSKKGKRKNKCSGTLGGGGSASEEQKLLDLINAFRAQNGQPALARNDKLDTAALNHSRDMASRRYFAHDTPEGVTPDQRLTAVGYSFSSCGENIYMSAPNDSSAQSAFTSWVNSSGHRANMLSGNFTQIGIGRATDADGRSLWTNTFGKPA